MVSQSKDEATEIAFTHSGTEGAERNNDFTVLHRSLLDVLHRPASLLYPLCSVRSLRFILFLEGCSSASKGARSQMYVGNP